MFLWFVGGSFLLIWLVLRDPRLDVRLLAVGSLLPDVVDVVFGGARAFHSITASVVLMVVVMLATIGRRSLRQQLLALVFGTFLHLVLDGVFRSTKVFWWPFTGAFGDERLPSLERGLAVNVVLELIGAGILAWAWRAFGLRDPLRRAALVRRGTVTRC
jgi:hypothetical protein